MLQLIFRWYDYEAIEIQYDIITTIHRLLMARKNITSCYILVIR